jgi:hypothetical protein
LSLCFLVEVCALTREEPAEGTWRKSLCPL